MGAHAYWYFVPYEQDVDVALQKLRHREFEAGRYNPATRYIEFPIDPVAHSPGAQHASIEEALEAGGMDGSRSILDLSAVADEPDYNVAAPLDDAVLEDLYETTRPTREMVESNMDFFETIERGQAIYIVVYKNGRPDELLFAGYSFD